jgi:hypothetical protein
MGQHVRVSNPSKYFQTYGAFTGFEVAQALFSTLEETIK